MTMGQARGPDDGALLPPQWIKGPDLTYKCVNRSGFRNQQGAPGLKKASITSN